MKTIEVKLLELRDRATFIPAVAILMESEPTPRGKSRWEPRYDR